MKDTPRRLAQKAEQARVLEVYADRGLAAAAEATEASPRTIQRWAQVAGVVSGWEPPDLVPCPSPAAYNRGCRCDGCIAANLEEGRVVKARRVKRGKTGKAEIPHGVTGYNNWNCRCEACRTEWMAYMRERRLVRAAAKEAR
jgi:hypothetical protein